ncbi:PQQ-dependent sugar dehydrogenase [Ilumatobacter nonamiensis]|uniref:PQQ-dependent sugar dehydrogenase n=1 Tax=Ilumatobacter nonamiensis TaxID=467093 RepID=UPI000346F63F|nr:PQQ-dependent sugar dehydrogenase [Ilumatobacter nonamiensis]
MRHRALQLRAAALTLAVVAGGCTSSDGDADGTTPGSADAVSSAETPDGDASSTATEPPPSDEPAATSADAPAESQPAPTTTLLPSPGADLPTQAPGDTVPVTTVAGPLPDLDVRLLELGTYDRPVDATTDEGDRRLFVVQQGGTIVAADDESDAVVFDISTVDATTFTAAESEQGLLGLAFHPEADLAYVNFTNGDGNTVVAEFAFDPVSYEFEPASFREVLTVEQPFANHNGGDLEFGPDGLLYISFGDGGAADDPMRTALNLSTRLGKLLRIDPTATDDASFTVPTDNPFVGTDGADPTIWALGLRNPWRFSFDAVTGDLWIADVGQGQFEEIDLATATDGRDAGKGMSFGWSAFEANEPFNDDQDPAGHVAPVAAYSHEGGNCSVSGGVVARDSSYSNLNGWYVYGDFCSGQLWALDTTSVSVGPDGPTGTPRIVEIGTVPALASVATGPFGDIYAISNGGQLYRLAQN